MYIEENGKYVFDGEFEEYLLNLGVEAEHIKLMKEKTLQSDEKYEYYIEKRELSAERLVPLSKVIGVGRGTVGKSVFDNVRIMNIGEREPYKFKKCFDFLNHMSLEELKESYEYVPPVYMTYFEDDDEYYLARGNHRTLIAMILGAKNIKAKVVPFYCDFDKRDKYLAVKKFYEDFNIVKINKTYTDTYEIEFIEDNELFVVNGFKSYEKEECYSLIDRLSQEIQKDRKKLKLWMKAPKKIKGILKLFYNERIEQYLNKSTFFMGDEELYIYKL